MSIVQSWISSSPVHYSGLHSISETLKIVGHPCFHIAIQGTWRFTFVTFFFFKFGLNFQPFFRPLRPKSAVSHKILILYKLTAVVVGIVEMKYEPSSQSNPRFLLLFLLPDANPVLDVRDACLSWLHNG